MRLSIGCGLYDRTLPLAQRVIEPAGLTLEWTSLPPHKLFKQALEGHFAVSEMSLAYYCITYAAGNRQFIALPIFPSRMFRHSSLYVRKESKIVPDQLRGARVGVYSYAMTAAVWVRWLLRTDYGIAPEEIHWFAGRMGPVPDRLRAMLPVKIVSGGETQLEDMLVSGELDVLLFTLLPQCFVEGKAGRLWPDYKEMEMAAGRKSGIFPIMHTLVIDRSLYEREPWIANSLFDAFLQAKDLCYKQLLDTDTPITTLPWLSGNVEEAKKILGEDYWPYGLAKNSSVIKTFLRELKTEGLLEIMPEPEEMFLPLDRLK